MPKATKKTNGTVVSDTESKESGQLSQSSSSESSDPYNSDTSDSGTKAQQAEVHRDNHGPPSEETALDLFYKEKKRVDARPITCVIHKKTLRLFFDTM